MYFPYLRSKQYEVLALRELATIVGLGGRVMPIIEPVNSRQLLNIVSVVERGLPLIVIENPAKGELAQQRQVVQRAFADQRQLKRPGVTRACLLYATTRRADIEGFLRRGEDSPFALVHFGSFHDPQWLAEQGAQYNIFLEGRSGSAYRDVFPKNTRVRLEDSFERRPRNEAYPPLEFFSDAHRRFRESGAGFGDFTIQGNYYTETGGAALAVAIHLVSREPNGDLWIRHFVSDRTTGRGVDTAGKFREALRKAVRFIESAENWMITAGCREFVDLHRRQHYPGLGYVKKVSIMHHLELVDALLGPAAE